MSVLDDKIDNLLSHRINSTAICFFRLSEECDENEENDFPGYAPDRASDALGLLVCGGGRSGRIWRIQNERERLHLAEPDRQGEEEYATVQIGIRGSAAFEAITGSRFPKAYPVIFYHPPICIPGDAL